MEIIYSLEELPEIAHKIWKYLQGGKSRIIAFRGDMGAGKTTFTKALLQAMGSTDTGNSPTFSIINQYLDQSRNAVYHMDWYRLRDAEEIIEAGGEEVIYSGNWCMVEWSEKAPELLPADTVYIYLTVQPDGKRQLIIPEKQD